MESEMSRRDLLRQGVVIGAAAAATRLASPAGAAPQAAGELPRIKLGTLEVSRLVLGSNPFWGYSHQTRELDEEMRDYYTDERIVAVLDEAASLGVTAVASPPAERWISLFDKYVRGGGKLKIWIAQPHDAPGQMKDEITRAVKGGAKAVFVQGHRTEEQFEKGNIKLLREWVEHIKGLGVPAGLAAHNPDVHRSAEKEKFPTDFYLQCLYNAPKGYNQEDREKAVATIAGIDKPVVAYKILGAGRVGAAEAFAYAFAHIRPKDGVCVGVFPKHKADQVREDAALTAKLSKG